MASRKNNLTQTIARTRQSVKAKARNKLVKRMEETAKQRARIATLSQVEL